MEGSTAPHDFRALKDPLLQLALRGVRGAPPKDTLLINTRTCLSPPTHLGVCYWKHDRVRVFATHWNCKILQVFPSSFSTFFIVLFYLFYHFPLTLTQWWALSERWKVFINLTTTEAPPLTNSGTGLFTYHQGNKQPGDVYVTWSTGLKIRQRAQKHAKHPANESKSVWIWI